jgi:hypothetical protein
MIASKIRNKEKMISQRELEKPTRVDLREITPFSMKMKTWKTFLLVV